MQPISIIILTYNQWTYTEACLRSIRRWTEMPVELIVVDNASTDGTPARLRQREPDRLILNHTNRGFAAGNNQGLALARGEYVLFLNNDVIVTPEWLDGLLAVLQEDVRAGAVGPVTNKISGHQQLERTGYQLSSPENSTEALDQWAREFRRQQRGRRQRVARLIGFCLLCRREAVLGAGGFDERYEIGNFEDDDLCFSLMANGYTLLRADDTFVHHWGSVSFRDNQIDYFGSLSRNLDRFEEKWRGREEYVDHFILRWRMELASRALSENRPELAMPQLAGALEYSPASLEIREQAERLLAKSGWPVPEKLQWYERLDKLRPLSPDGLRQALELASGQTPAGNGWLTERTKTLDGYPEEVYPAAVRYLLAAGRPDEAAELTARFRVQHPGSRRVSLLMRMQGEKNDGRDAP